MPDPPPMSSEGDSGPRGRGDPARTQSGRSNRGSQESRLVKFIRSGDRIDPFSI